MKAHEILNSAAGHLADRAKTYDKPEGERSMAATVEAFKAVTGHEITETQGWLFMALLKAVRSQQGEFKMDSFEDGAAYFALAGESASLSKASDKAIDELAVDANAPDWKGAPHWAQWVAQDKCGEWWWHSEKPDPSGQQWLVSGDYLDLASKGDGWPNPNWRETLQARPANNDDWIEWHGGECPVGQNEIVEIRFRGSMLAITSRAPHTLFWQHHGLGGDIIAYRIIKE